MIHSVGGAAESRLLYVYKSFTSSGINNAANVECTGTSVNNMLVIKRYFFILFSMFMAQFVPEYKTLLYSGS